MNTELTDLINEFKNKKNMLDTKTKDIALAIRDWCITEYKRLEDERTDLLNIFLENWNSFGRKMSVKDYTDHSYYTWNGLELRVTKGNGKTTIGLTSNYEYDRGFGYTWTKLPKPKNNFNLNSERVDIDYWTDMKKFLAINNESLNELKKLTKDFIGTMILEQEQRFNDMKSACDDIAKNF